MLQETSGLLDFSSQDIFSLNQIHHDFLPSYRSQKPKNPLKKKRKIGSLEVSTINLSEQEQKVMIHIKSDQNLYTNKFLKKFKALPVRPQEKLHLPKLQRRIKKSCSPPSCAGFNTHKRRRNLQMEDKVWKENEENLKKLRDMKEQSRVVSKNPRKVQGNKREGDMREELAKAHQERVARGQHENAKPVKVSKKKCVIW